MARNCADLLGSRVRSLGGMHPLAAVAPQFVEMAHRIVWCVAATVDASGAPRTRVLHPVWEWDEAAGQLTGWIATGPQSPKAGGPGQDPVAVADVLGPDAGHVHRRLRRDLGRHRGVATCRVGAFPDGAGTGGLRPVDHPGVGHARLRGVRRDPALAAAPPGHARHRDDRWRGRSAHLAALTSAPFWSPETTHNRLFGGPERGVPRCRAGFGPLALNTAVTPTRVLQSARVLCVSADVFPRTTSPEASKVK